jgi:hypothetical protein
MRRFRKNIHVANQWMTTNRFAAKLIQGGSGLISAQHFNNGGPVATSQCSLTRAARHYCNWLAIRKDFDAS